LISKHIGRAGIGDYGIIRRHGGHQNDRGAEGDCGSGDNGEASPF
jgi:hypothetical protein